MEMGLKAYYRANPKEITITNTENENINCSILRVYQESKPTWRWIAMS